MVECVLLVRQLLPAVVLREWLRGGVQPCQGWGRGFESRLALLFVQYE